MATDTSVDVAPRGETSPGENFYLHALLGAVVTAVTSFVPFSPILGGAVAGYLQERGTGVGARVGAVSGIIAALPLAGIFFVVFSVMSFGSIMTGEFAGPLFVIVLVGTVLLFVGLYVVGLSALGGYIGASFADSRAERRLAAELEAGDDGATVAAGTKADSFDDASTGGGADEILDEEMDAGADERTDEVDEATDE